MKADTGMSPSGSHRGSPSGSPRGTSRGSPYQRQPVTRKRDIEHLDNSIKELEILRKYLSDITRYHSQFPDVDRTLESINEEINRLNIMINERGVHALKASKRLDELIAKKNILSISLYDLSRKVANLESRIRTLKWILEKNGNDYSMYQNQKNIKNNKEYN